MVGVRSEGTKPPQNLNPELHDIWLLGLINKGWGASVPTTGLNCRQRELRRLQKPFRYPEGFCWWL